ncbi:MAG: hypothetical protein ACFFCS_20170 [Candidatus Hodarchaeota archaeon]
MTLDNLDSEDQVVEIYNFIFLGETKVQLDFFRSFFNQNIEFSARKSIFYYPFKISDDVLIKSFAAMKASLELVRVPKQYAETDCIFIVINLCDADSFDTFIPFFQKILEKQSRCPPVFIVGYMPDETSRSREISYFGTIALKTFITKTFETLEIHYLEWDLRSTFDGKQALVNLILENLPVIDIYKHDKEKTLSRLRIKSGINKLQHDIQEFKFLDKKQGLKYLILDERYKRKISDFSFLGYARDHMISRGLDPLFVKDILDEWEGSLAENDSNKSVFKVARDKIPEILENAQKRLIPINLYSLISKLQMEYELAKIVLQNLKDDNYDVDFHDTHKIVDELKNIMEIIVILKGQPIFSYLPNEKTGFGSTDNVTLISGMIHILSLLRDKVYVLSDDGDSATVERIKYGPLNLTIAQGQLTNCVIHSLMPLSDDLVLKLERFVHAFESTNKEDIENFKGEMELLNEPGKKLYLDIFTPLPIKYINKNWKLKELRDERRKLLTNFQVKVLEIITRLQDDGKIKEAFHLEDILKLLSGETKISTSDLLLLLPGELLVMD